MADEEGSVELLKDQSAAAFLRLRAGFVVLSGAEAGKEIYFSKEKIVVGRADECDIRVPDASVSRQHATIHLKGGRFVLKDLGSTNGTLVNGEAQAERVLEWGDRIQVGPLAFRYIQDEKPRFQKEMWAFETAARRAQEELRSLRTEIEQLRAAGATPAAPGEAVPASSPSAADGEATQRRIAELETARAAAETQAREALAEHSGLADQIIETERRARDEIGAALAARDSAVQALHGIATESAAGRFDAAKEWAASAGDAAGDLARLVDWLQSVAHAVTSARKSSPSEDDLRRVSEDLRGRANLLSAERDAMRMRGERAEADAQQAKERIEAMESERDSRRSENDVARGKAEEKSREDEEVRARLSAERDEALGRLETAERDLENARREASDALQAKDEAVMKAEDAEARSSEAESSARRADEARAAAVSEADAARKAADIAASSGESKELRASLAAASLALSARTAELEEVRARAGAAVDLVRLREVDLIKTDGISTVFDEFQTSLRVVKEYIQGMMANAGGQLEPGQAQFVEKVLSATAPLERLLFDLVTFSSLSAQDAKLPLVRLSLREVVDPVVTKLRSYADRKRLTFRVSDIPGGWTVDCDRERIAEVLTTLLRNAIKFTPDGALVALDVSEEAREFRLAILETGTKVKRVRSDRIFLAFEGMATGLQKKIAGTGLKMPILQSIIERHGGRMWLEAADDGNRFVFSLPKP